ncbi:MAG: chemotaxis response regulator protein-glutamate methylesterase [Candidatus Baltobacteraceae bacterium]
MPISVLVVDDSAFMRRAISKMLELEPEIVVSATARSGEDAVEKAARLNPDVITMDVEMPGIGGLEAVRQIMAARKVPIIMVSSLTREGAETTFRALDLGAVDFIPKPDSAYVEIKNVARDLIAKVRVFARRPAPGTPPARETQRARRRTLRERFECVAIGTSTGGPVALSRIIPKIPADFPIPIVIVQHMPAGFTRPLAERLDAQSHIRVLEGHEGMILRAGLALVVPSGKQLHLARSGGEVEVRLVPDRDHSLHVPSVDVMIAEVAQIYGSRSLGVILTGMGQDGVAGLRELKTRGGYVVGQDEASSVVYGMPRAASVAGLVDRVAALDDIPPLLCELTNTSFARS